MGALGGGKGSHVEPEPHADATERRPRSILRGLRLLSVRVSCPGPESRIRKSLGGVRSELLLVGAYPSRNGLSRDLKGSYVRSLSPLGQGGQPKVVRPIKCAAPPTHIDQNFIVSEKLG